MYAVVRTGGKQYRVEEGRALKIERLAGEVGDVVEVGDVLLMDDGSGVTVGAPTISGARVLGTIAEQGRSKKIIVFRYKAKTRYRKKTGHRQPFTKVLIEDILLPGQEPKPKAAVEPEPLEAEAEPPKGRRARKAAHATAAVEPDVAPEATVPATDTPAEAAEKPKRSRRKAE
ncbi:MAG: 50S ribosomal protein L21 [Chloroflexi bacterium]|nr:50S ribosomal protein L21 [Chloroflexota bacterium]